MRLIDKDLVPLRYYLGLFEGKPEELLWQIFSFLEKEDRESLEFNLSDLNLKTSVRMSKSLEKDLDTLIKLGYVEKLKYTKYRAKKNLWEHGKEKESADKQSADHRP